MPSSREISCPNPILFTFLKIIKSNENLIKIIYLKQKLCSNNHTYDLFEIYGQEEQINEDILTKKENYNRECSVCMTNPKTIIVLPCRHLFICRQCTQITINDYSLCPICRTSIQAFVSVGNIN